MSSQDLPRYGQFSIFRVFSVYAEIIFFKEQNENFFRFFISILDGFEKPKNLFTLLSL
jgi:hypothetical protein